MRAVTSFGGTHWSEPRGNPPREGIPPEDALSGANDDFKGPRLITSSLLRRFPSGLRWRQQLVSRGLSLTRACRKYSVERCDTLYAVQLVFFLLFSSTNKHYTVTYYYLLILRPRRGRSIAKNVFACGFVSVRSRISKITCPNFGKFSVWPWLGPPLTRMQCVMQAYFRFVDWVMFYIIDQMYPR